MNFRTIIILSAILPAVPLYARDKADVMIMKNGDRMTCEVKVLEAGVSYVDVEYIVRPEQETAGTISDECFEHS